MTNINKSNSVNNSLIQNKNIAIIPSDPKKTKVNNSGNSEKNIVVSNNISDVGKQSGSAKSNISLGFDSSKPGSPDKAETKNRFHDRGRDINVPLLTFNDGKASLQTPLPISGFTDATADLDRDGEVDGIGLKGFSSNPDMIFKTTDLTRQSVAALYDELSTKFPKLEKNVLWRLAKVGTLVAIDIPLMVAAHEMGHAATANDNCPGCNPSVNMTGLAGGYSSYDYPEDGVIEENGDYSFPDGTIITPEQRLMNSVSGMNQATYSGEQVMRRMHTEGSDFSDAVAYLVDITNNVNYQMKDWIMNNEPGFDDAATYHGYMDEKSELWNEKNLSLLALGANVLNADFWASLIGTVNYIATGKQVKLPEIEIGNVGVSLPNFSVINTTEGPQLNTSVFGHMNTPATLELKYSTILTPDNGPAHGAELRLHNYDVPGTKGNLAISPRAGLSYHNQSLGFKVGSAIDIRPGGNEHFAVRLDADYRKNYMPDNYLPNSSSFQASTEAVFNF